MWEGADELLSEPDEEDGFSELSILLSAKTSDFKIYKLSLSTEESSAKNNQKPSNNLQRNVQKEFSN